MRKPKSQRGFSLLELLVASSVGLSVILVGASLFKTGMDATVRVTQRAETQQNMRAAMEMITKDISLAGAGLPAGGVQLTTAGVSLYGCSIPTAEPRRTICMPSNQVSATVWRMPLPFPLLWDW